MTQPERGRIKTRPLSLPTRGMEMAIETHEPKTGKAPVVVTVNHDDEIMFWADEQKALDHIKMWGGNIESIPETVEDYDDEDEDHEKT